MKDRFYFPIKAIVYEDEFDEETCEMLPSTLLGYVDKINSKLESYQVFDGKTMLDFLMDRDIVGDKLTALKWGVCELENNPYGYVEIEFTEGLTDTEISSLKDWISGQNSDGLGEGFEQQPFEIHSGEMYVSLWNSSDDYFIKSQSEMDEYLNRYTINLIDSQDLRTMRGTEGIIFQGCGGSLAEWVTGVNEMLTDANILKNGTKFRNVYSFKNENCTNLMFPFDKNVSLDMGKLAMWRIATHEQFGAKWASDYVDNFLGGYIDETPEESAKPDCALIGQDGNIFNLMGIASRTLRQNGMADKATEMCERINSTAEDYYQALGIIGEYVNITSVDEDMDEGMGGME